MTWHTLIIWHDYRDLVYRELARCEGDESLHHPDAAGGGVCEIARIHEKLQRQHARVLRKPLVKLLSTTSCKLQAPQDIAGR